VGQKSGEWGSHRDGLGKSATGVKIAFEGATGGRAGDKEVVRNDSERVPLCARNFVMTTVTPEEGTIGRGAKV